MMQSVHMQSHKAPVLGNTPGLGAPCPIRRPLQPLLCKPARQRSLLTHAEPPGRDPMPPPPMPPPPRPPPGQQPPGYEYDQQQQPFRSATPRFQDLTWSELKEVYLRPSYLPLSFTLGALTLGLRLGAANYTFSESPLEFLGTAISTGVMCMALAWVLFDFTDNPPPGSNFSSPRK